jgi:hypothetical protein
VEARKTLFQRIEEMEKKSFSMEAKINSLSEKIDKLASAVTSGRRPRSFSPGRFENVICRRCSKKGHIQRNCPEGEGKKVSFIAESSDNDLNDSGSEEEA